MFGISGKLRASDSSIIDWTNGETWRKAPPPQAAAARPPPPPLLAAGEAGAKPDYWAASFASAAARASDAPRPVESAASAASPAVARGGGAASPSRYDDDDDDDDEDEANNPFDPDDDDFDITKEPALQPALASRSTPTSTPSSTRGRTPSSPSSHPLTGLLVLVLATAFVGAAVFAAMSYRRHGAIDAQLLVDDWRALQDAVRAKVGAQSGGMQRVQVSEEDAELGDFKGEGGGVGAKVAMALAKGLSAAGALTATVVSALGREPEVTSAADDQPAAQAPDRDEYAPQEMSFTSPKTYEWEGEKLSWEVGGGLPPEKLDEVEDFAEESGEVC